MIKYIQAFDLVTFLSVFNYTRHNNLAKIARLISATADGWYYSILVPLIILLKPGQYFEYLYLVVLGFCLERIVYFSLKNTFKRRRPYHAIRGFKSIIMASDEFSLPSGHTSAAFFFATFLSFALSPLFLPLYLWAAFVGISRVVLGVHFITDVCIGAIIGTCIALLVL